MTINTRTSAQSGWDVTLDLSTTAPIEGCTPIRLTFDWVQSLEDEDPLTGAILELYILDNDGLSFAENPGFVKQAGFDTIQGEEYVAWRLENIEIPSIDDGGTIAIHATLVQTGYLEALGPLELFYQGFIPSDSTGFEPGPNLIPDVTFHEIGTSSSSETDLSDEIGNLLPISDVVIHGTLYADANFDFDDNYKIYMGEDALIQVEDGVELKFTDRTILQGCVDVWAGIEVLNGGKLIVDGSTDQSSDKVVVQGAENGVTVRDGADIFVKEAIFRNNGTGIWVPEIGGDGHNQAGISVNSATFVNDGSYPGMTAVTGIHVNKMAKPLLSAGNSFKNLEWGILGYRSHVTSDSDYFENCNSQGISVRGPSYTLTQTGKGLNEANPTFVDCGTGIWAENMNVVSGNNVMLGVNTGYSLRKGVFRKVHIHDNLIRANYSGIAVNYWYSLPSFVVEDNEVYLDETPTHSAGIFAELLTGNSVGRCRFDGNLVSVGEARYGIYLSSSYRAGLNENEVELKYPMTNYGILLEYTDRSNLFCNLVEGTTINGYQSGIRLATTSLNSLGCNTLDLTGIGIHFLGENVPTTLRGNGFNSHDRALQYGWDEAGPFPLGAQTGVQSHHGNRWLETYDNGSFGVGHYGSELQITNSKIEYDPNDEPDPPSVTLTTNEDQSNSLFDDISGSTYLCSNEVSGCPPPAQQLPDGIGVADLNTVKDIQDTSHFAEPQAWVAKRQLYRRLLDDTTLLSADTLVENFFLAQSSTSVGIYESLRKDIGGLFVPGAADSSQLETDLDSLLARIGELQGVEEELLDEELTAGARDTLLAEKSVLLQGIDSLTAGYLQLCDTLESQRVTDARQILSANANAPDDEAYETYQRTVNRIMLEFIIERQGVLTDTQATDLGPIANTCPFLGGPAVYQARALLGDGAVYNDDSLCYVVTQPLRRPKEPEQAIEFRVYPNPASGVAAVELNQAIEEDGEIVLTNALGRQVYRQRFSKGDQTIYLIIDEIPAGSYYLTLFSASKSSTKNLTILK